MNPKFFEQPILNSPYEAPSRHWEFDDNGQPTHRIVEAEVAGGGMAKHEGQADLGPVVAGIRTGDAPLRRDEALGTLRAHKAMIVERFDVVRLTLFGSVARDQAEPDSDLDLLVEFRGEKSRSK